MQPAERLSATQAAAAGFPPPSARMCQHCAQCDASCPLDTGDVEVLTCVEFAPTDSTVYDAWALWLAQWSRDRPAVFRALCHLVRQSEAIAVD